VFRSGRTNEYAGLRCVEGALARGTGLNWRAARVLPVGVVLVSEPLRRWMMDGAMQLELETRRIGWHRWRWPHVVAVLWAVFSLGCMAQKSPPSPRAYRAQSVYAAESGYPDAVMEMSARPRSAGAVSSMSPPPSAAEAAGAPPPTAVAERKIYYSGHARLRVQSIEETTDALTRTAKAVGGFVESVTGRVVTLRVPVDGFEASFDQMIALGDLLDRSISARDVTEAFTAVDLRLSTARKTRDRLVELLARAEAEQEKLALIKQIQRVSEEIDRLESQLRTLDSLASMSRITMELVPREAQAWRDEANDTSEMAWIRALSPFRPDLVSDGRKLLLPVPEGMVQLTPTRRFIAEGPDGSRVWSGRLANEPSGDGEFWVEAIRSRIGSEFAAAELVELGGFTVLKLTDRGDDPYSWWIAIRPRGKWLDVVEVYFPTPAELARFEAAVRASLTGSGGAA
jgi:hypothetical protein